MKIIAVDDMKQNRYLLQKILEGYGYGVETASNGVEALEKARASPPPDMIITDVLMPRMDGFQLCRTLKSDEKLKDIPVLFYSAEYTDKKSRELALSIGAAGYIVKPIEPDEFIKIVKATFEKYAKSEFKPPEKPLEEQEYMKLYSERLIQKLEKKVLDLEKANKMLNESEQKYRELVDNANDAVIVIEPTGYLRFVNPKFCEMVGYTMEEAKKLHFSTLIHPEDVAIVTENFRKRLSGEEVPQYYEFRMLTKLEEPIYVDYNANLIKREGKTVGVQAIIRDLTERRRKKMLEAQSELRTILTDAIPVLLMGAHPEKVNMFIHQMSSSIEAVLWKKHLAEVEEVNLNILGKILCEIMNKLGGDFEIESVDDKECVVKGNACPWGAQAQRNRVLCMLCRGIFSRLASKVFTTVAVNLIKTIGNKDDYCIINIQVYGKV